MSALLSLPDEVLKLVLTHVPLENRLGSCCLVHTRLHAAAVSATQQVQFGRQLPLEPEGAQSAMSWLSRYGQHVTRLEMTCFPQRLTQLQSCPNLLDLRSYGGSIQLGPTADGGPGVVAGITKLTRLELSIGTIATGVVVDSLSSLVHLRHLEVTAELSAATLPRLQHLTHLTSRGMSLENLCQLSALTALQELVCMAAQHIQDSPRSVSGLALPAYLTKLDLTTNSVGGVEAALVPHVPTGVRALSITFSCMEALEHILSCMARLQCLTQLELHDCGPLDWPPPGPAYSALTASSSLVSLELVGDFPPEVWPFVFPAPQQLPHLTSLVFDECWEEPEAAWAFEASDVAALVSCCPGLCEIKYMCLQPGPHVSELHKLTSLTKLYVYGAEGELVGTVEGLAAVTQLCCLTVYLADEDEPLSVASLLPLTSLTRLTSLCCTLKDVHEVDYFTEAGCPPDVWLHLLERCVAADSSCQPTALRGLAQQLAEQRALTAAQAQQIAGLQAQLSAHQQRNEVLHQQHMAAQQRLSAQQQVAAEQGARITELEGQLQQLLQRLL